ncbi:hypothetical protein LEP1GSC170_1146 [Leptospira interrogans serovar Bataviae str. HAI135]|nr:hypothetical protein LEP1GSC170_1146 [Leptospira interrogans serovar Bataviae str. HAI135]
MNFRFRSFLNPIRKIIRTISLHQAGILVKKNFRTFRTRKL